MFQTASPAPADRLALIIEGLCQVIARRCGLGGLAGPLITLIWSRLRRIAVRFTRAALVSDKARINPSRPEAVIAASSKASGTQAKARPKFPLPRRKAWLLRLAPETASAASQLRYFLADPEVTALLTEAPRLHRILRPLCHALGIRAAGTRPVQALPAQAPPPLPPAPDTPAIPCHLPKQDTPTASPPWTTPPLSPDSPPPALA